MARFRGSGWSEASSSKHHFAGLAGAFRFGLDDHAFRRGADAGGCKRAFAFNIDHAGPAIAVGAVAGCILVAQMRNRNAFPLGNLPDGFAFLCGDILAVEGESDLAHLSNSSGKNLSTEATGLLSCLAKTADRSGAHDRIKIRDLRFVPVTGRKQLFHLFRAGPAGRALAAAFMLEEPHQVQRHIPHVILIGKDHDGVGCR